MINDPSLQLNESYCYKQRLSCYVALNPTEQVHVDTST